MTVTIKINVNILLISKTFLSSPSACDSPQLEQDTNSLQLGPYSNCSQLEQDTNTSPQAHTSFPNRPGHYRPRPRQSGQSCVITG